jgi:hypothetical protein
MEKKVVKQKKTPSALLYLVLHGSGYAHGHNRFQNNRVCGGENGSHGALRGQSESKFGRIDLVSLAILEDEPDARDGVANKQALRKSVAETLHEQFKGNP